MKDFPDWWSWELQFCDHVLLRMSQRNFNEADLRAMLEDATTITPDPDPGRWRVIAQFRGTPWAVILEPDLDENIIVVITAFEID